MDSFRKSAIGALAKATALKPKRIDELLEVPPNSKMGELSFPCFSIAKDKKISPGNVALNIRERLVIPKEFSSVITMGPYLNFFYNREMFNKSVLTASLKKDYGRGKNKEKVLLDLFQANPFKEFHIGHLRNAVLGESVRRISEFSGAKTYSVSYVGDVGIHISKWLWYYGRFYKGNIPSKNVSRWAGEIYVKAIKKLAENEKKYMIEVNELNKKLAMRDPKVVKLWKNIRDSCFADADRIADELGAKVDRRIPESEIESSGIKKVLELLDKGKLKKDDGAIVIDLEKYGLGVFILLKSDGTALYSTKDVGLINLKSKLFKADKFLYVVGSEQEYYFRQLFKVFGLLGISDEKKNIHISHGLVSLKAGKMSSRLGNVVTYEDLRDAMRARAHTEIKKRNKGISAKKLSNLSTKVSNAAMIFGMLKYSNIKPVVFDMEQTLRFDGDTGPYLQYSLVRATKILKKSGEKKCTA